MRVILVFAICAMVLPAFAGSPTPETALPDTPQAVLDSAARDDVAEQAVSGLVPETVEAASSKEHNNQVDEPDHPPCGDGG
jgi:hypothetical protein